jgi:methionyl-tRNA formyltransferase
MENKSIQIRTVFMGTSSLSAKILSELINAQYNIIGVYTKQDKKVGRSQQVSESEVKKVAIENKLEIYQPTRFDDATVSELKKLKPDLIVVAAYGKILPKSVLEIPGFGCLNVHVSLLPKFRGPSPIQNALLCGEKETGITIMLMDEGIDTGDIIAQQAIEIDPDDTTQSLTEKLSDLGAKFLLETIPLWVKRKIEPIKQDHTKATLCQLIEREDGKIFWEDEAVNIYNKYRALYPWPGIFTYWQKDNGSLLRLKLLKVSLHKNNPVNLRPSGEVFELGDKIGVQTLKGVICLEEVQLEGKKPSDIKAFINGYPNFIGTVLK